MSTAFVSVAELEAYVGHPVDPATGDLACAAASDAVRGYCGRTFDYEPGVVISLDGSGQTGLVLPSPPIRAVEQVLENGVALVEGTDFAVIAAPGILRRVDGAAWCWGILNVAVTYDRGFDLDPPAYPPGGDPLPLPDAIRMATLSLAKRMAASGSLPTGGLRSETAGAYSYTMGDPSQSSVFYPSADEQLLLDPWRLQGVA